MKANAGGVVTGAAIIGREANVAEIFTTLEKRSIVFSSERRVGKTTIMIKIEENPRDGWVPLRCQVESCGHPIECVRAIYQHADSLEVRTKASVWAANFHQVWDKISKGKYGEWELPGVNKLWKQLLNALVRDIVENTDHRLLIMLDEFPHFINNITKSGDNGPATAMEFLSTLREIRQQWEASGQIRFILAGSIGLHLVLDRLRKEEGYTDKPTNDMAPISLGGMTEDEVALMCRRYLEEEGIRRDSPEGFGAHMYAVTEGLPLYIQYICEQIQNRKPETATVADIDVGLDKLMNDTEIEWFRDAAKRIDDYYPTDEDKDIAHCVLNFLSRQEELMTEDAVIKYVKSQTPVERSRKVTEVLELLVQDHYLRRETEPRRYAFTYRIMREWWRINRG